MSQAYQQEPRSDVEITTLDGKVIRFEMNATPGVIPHILKEMRNTGMLTLWNEHETLCVMATQIKSVQVFALGGDEE